MSRFKWNTGIRRTFVAGVSLLFLAGVTPFWAQVPDNNPEPVAPPPSAQQQPQQQPLSPQQLDDLVAPVALYPDPLLGQAMAASTYPLEIVEAQQWLQAHSNLTGTSLTSAAREQNWDPSVQALVAFPDAMKLLSQNMQWTTALGNAFLSQQADVMAAVQRMRARAQANGRLQSSPQETVATQAQNGQQAISIEPTDPQVMYVPEYDPAYIWGPPAYGYYPPLYYPAYGFGWGPGIDIGFCFGPWAGFGWGGWGWGPNWFGGGLFVNAGWFGHYGYRGFGGYGRGFGVGSLGAWAHDPGHRLGVGYPNGALAGRFGAASMAGRINASRAAVNTGRATPGGWQRFGSPGAANSFQGGRGNYEGSRGVQSQTFRGNEGVRGNTAPAARGYSAPAQRGYSAPAQRSYAAPAARSYSAPAQRSYSAPAQRSYSAPAQRSYSAPSGSSSGGGSRSFSGSGGGGFHGGGGGGGTHGGGGGHGGRR